LKFSPTQRGLGLLFSLIPLTIISCITLDPIIAVTTAAILLILLGDLICFTYTVRKNPCICNDRIEKRIWIWDNPSIELKITCKNGVNVTNTPSWLIPQQVDLVDNILKIRIKASFPYYGLYEVNNISIERISKLRLFKTQSDVNVLIRFKVLPETLYWLIIALNILGIGKGYGGIHDISELTIKVSELRSISGVYYETREYTPGDPLKRIDWKATARRRKLMVKEFREELSGAGALCFDEECIGPHTCDSIASAILSITIAAVRQGIPITTVVDLTRSNIIKFSNPKYMLMYFINKVLELNIVDKLDLYEYIEPPTLREIQEKLAILLNKNIYVKRKTTSPIELLREGNIIIVSNIIHNTKRILDITDKLSHKRVRTTLITPDKPWIDGRDLEEAYRIYTTHNLVIEKLRKMNINVVPWHRLRLES